MLEAEQSDQPEVDENRRDEAPGGPAAVDGERDLREIPGEGDQIEEGREEDEVSDNAEQKVECARRG